MTIRRLLYSFEPHFLDRRIYFGAAIGFTGMICANAYSLNTGKIKSAGTINDIGAMSFGALFGCVIGGLCGSIFPHIVTIVAIPTAICTPIVMAINKRN